MGTLSDITANANIVPNRKPRSKYLKVQEALETPASVKLSPTAPRFMSPTIASSQQGLSPSAYKGDRTSTPTSILSSKARNSSWMASAVKRIGISRMNDNTPRTNDGTSHISDGTPRTNDGTPHMKKYSSPTKSKDLTVPDKLETRSYMQLPESPPTNDVSMKALPSEKPLPSPPLSHLVTGSPIKESRCLIDASEKPLRRSPPGKPHQEEEWPVLSPEKPTTPATLRELHGQDKQKLIPSSAKYHNYSHENSTSVQPIQHKPVSTDKSMTKPSASLRQKDLHLQAYSTDRDCLNVPATAAKTLTLSDPKLPFDLSASASALEKSAQEANKFPEPRPTRTSSLRARISTGNLTTNTKVVGFTDFTTIKEGSGITEQGTLRIPSDSRSHSKSPLLATASGKKPSLKSVRTNRAPAKYVASSRRSAIPHRPGSPGSSRGDAHDQKAIEGTYPPSRNAPGVLASKISEPETAKGPKDQSEAAAPERRPSSIPFSRGAVRSILDHDEDEADVTKLAPTVIADFKHRPRKGFNVFEDRKSATRSATRAAVVSGAPSKRKQGQEPLTKVKKAERNPTLEAVSESPRSSYQIKRLSRTSPEHGPTLRISPSAERLIMGKDTDMEDEQNYKMDQNKDLRRTVVTNELRKTATDAGFRSESIMHEERPHTTPSLVQSRSRVYIIDDEFEQEEQSTVTNQGLPTSSVDLECSGPKTTESSSNEDPFFDAQSHIPQNGSATVETCPAVSVLGVGVDASVERPKDVQNIISVDEASWISPMPKKISNLRLSDAMPVTPAFLPASMLEHVRNSVPAENTANIAYTTKCAQSSLEAKLDSANVPEGLLSTAQHPDQDRPSTSPGNFPPRSSSRVQAYDHTASHPINNNSPGLPTDDGSRLSDEFRTRQNRLGQGSGLGSAQLDLTKPNAKRNSVARESDKSQGSYSKGVLSNFRGLFHKRSGDTPELRSSFKETRKCKGKVSITSKGSPFPAMSEVHPVHRPMLTSTSKSRAAATVDKKTLFQPRESPSCNNDTGEITPTFHSPVPAAISTTTNALSMQVIDSAHLEPSSLRREGLVELSQILAEALAQAREAEMAMWEARHAAARAEVSYTRCLKSVDDVKMCIEKWRAHSGDGRL